MRTRFAQYLPHIAVQVTPGSSQRLSCIRFESLHPLDILNATFQSSKVARNGVLKGQILSDL